MREKWQVSDVLDYGDQLVVNGLPQFGFHVHTGECYMVHWDLHIVGLTQRESLAWTLGQYDPGVADMHYHADFANPRFVSRSFRSPHLYIAEEEGIWQLDLETMSISKLIDRESSGIREIGNCVPDRRGDLWINDISGCRVFRFDSQGQLIEVLGTRNPGFQIGEANFQEAQFNWMYDLRLAPDDTLYLLDSRNYAVRHIDAEARTVATICGDGTPGYSGDGGPAALARLGGTPSADFDGPWSLFVLDSGDIVIGDTHNHAIRLIDRSDGTIRTILGGQVTPEVVLEKICGMDARVKKLLIPDWRERASRTLIIASSDP